MANSHGGRGGGRYHTYCEDTTLVVMNSAVLCKASGGSHPSKSRLERQTEGRVVSPVTTTTTSATVAVATGEAKKLRLTHSSSNFPRCLREKAGKVGTRICSFCRQPCGRGELLALPGSRPCTSSAFGVGLVGLLVGARRCVRSVVVRETARERERGGGWVEWGERQTEQSRERRYR